MGAALAARSSCWAAAPGGEAGNPDEVSEEAKANLQHSIVMGYLMDHRAARAAVVAEAGGYWDGSRAQAAEAEGRGCLDES